MLNILLFALIGCGETKPEDTSSEPATEPSNEAAVEPSDDTAVEETFTISGSVVYDNGEPAAGAKIQVCASLCRRADVTEDGSWSLSGLEAEHYIVLGFVQGDSTIATVATLIDVTADKELTPMTIVPYETKEAYVAGPHTYLLSSGLELKLNSDEISAGVYSIGSSDTVSSVSVDPSTIPSDYDSSSVLHMWMLGDYDHGSESGMKLSFTGTLDVEDGATVDLLYINNEAHEWQSLGTFTVTGGGQGGDARWLQGQHCASLPAAARPAWVYCLH